MAVEDCIPCGNGAYCASGACTPGGILYREGFEDEALPPEWSSPSSRPWELDAEQPYLGEQSVRSGRVATNDETRLTLQLESVPEGATVSFWFRTTTDQNLDSFSFEVEDRVEARWAGQRDWERAEFELTRGLGVALVWRYARGSTDSDGGGTVWLDDVLVQLRCE